jgi:hypothetical protein
MYVSIDSSVRNVGELSRFVIRANGLVASALRLLHDANRAHRNETEIRALLIGGLEIFDYRAPPFTGRLCSARRTHEHSAPFG